MKYCLVLVFCCCAAQVLGQHFVERVYLKDSTTVYEGYIIEQAPAKYIKIYRLKEKDTVEVMLTAIWKLTKEYDVPQKKPKTTAAAPKRYYKSAFFELGGKALLYSFNYDMRTERGRRNGWGFTAGFNRLAIKAVNTANAGDSVSLDLTMFPFSINYLFGKRKGFFELGAGGTYIFFKGVGNLVGNQEAYQLQHFDISLGSILGNFTIGYRHMPLSNGINWRIALNPIFFGSNQLIPWLGFSIGYQFW